MGKQPSEVRAGQGRAGQGKAGGRLISSTYEYRRIDTPRKLRNTSRLSVKNGVRRAARTVTAALYQ
ncbi:hypothetical protein E2C01_008775 [Portunus trituberculatus]|uniref:Uncharacterized protein n=1 Tax=Portunus trituberculatus TaxID=210409 RepID=A0A5B7D2U9_PORTR|nr:hypothetical protein [Portunus trituberculatus]